VCTPVDVNTSTIDARVLMKIQQNSEKEKFAKSLNFVKARYITAQKSRVFCVVTMLRRVCFRVV